MNFIPQYNLKNIQGLTNLELQFGGLIFQFKIIILKYIRKEILNFKYNLKKIII